MNLSHKQKAVALLNSIETGDKKAITYVNSAQYTQHNLMVADGLAGFGELMQALPKDSAKVKVVRAFEDGDFVFTHTDYNFFGPKVGFDIFRFEQGKIVEHWDNLTEKTLQLNPSGRSQLDGVTVISDFDKTEQNRQLVTHFVNTVLVKGHFDQLANFISEQQYLQHNSQIADGLTGLADALTAMQQQGITMSYHKVHKVLAEGNFVLTVSEGSFADKPTSFYDLFRVEQDKIVEHWDVIESMLPPHQWKNSNGKFGGLAD